VTPEQAALLRKAARSVRLARRLLDEGEVETVVSLAYYAMFYVAEAFLLGDGLAFSKHGAVIGAFGQHFAKTDRVPTRTHRDLMHAFEGRIAADYEAPSGLVHEDAACQVSHAEDFLALAEQMLGPIPEADEETR
jgi:uncharacterized protein (UPF0332 family)